MLKKHIITFLLFLTFGFSFSQNKGGLKDIKIYPNPAGSFFSVKSQGVTIERIVVFSILGVKERVIKDHFYHIDIGQLPEGIYMIKIYTRKGYVVKKLIKNRPF